MTPLRNFPLYESALDVTTSSNLPTRPGIFVNSIFTAIQLVMPPNEKCLLAIRQMPRRLQTGEHDETDGAYKSTDNVA